MYFKFSSFTSVTVMIFFLAFQMRPFVKIVFENVVNKVTFTGRHESLIQLPDSVIPAALHKQIMSYHKYKVRSYTVLDF